ncbi:MAG: glycosyltransferase family 4 protein [Candidatus Marinimicrobia bacterium]|nr:glycosyltransferase family 4 protein [Candidatus Neomarinimicrobiota bacterium]
MRILHIMPYSPVPPTFGGALREYYILKNLLREHQVTVVFYGTEEDRQNLGEEFGDAVESIHAVPQPWERKFRRIAQLRTIVSQHSYFYHNNIRSSMQSKVDDLFRMKNFDMVHFEFSIMGSIAVPDNIPTIVDTHNVEYANFRRMWKKSTSPIRKWFYGREYKKVYQEEVDILGNQDAIFVTSGNDGEIMDQDIPEVPKHIIPNGVDTIFFTPESSPVKPNSLVFTGMMAYTPNNDGMLYFMKEIFPLIRAEVPDVQLSIVGKRPTKKLQSYASKQVEVTGFVEDVRPYIRNASVYIVPLRMGSGTRLKVLEALATKKPVVSTSIGCEGIDVEDGKSILIRDEPKPFAKSVINLLKDEKRRQELAMNGYRLIKKKYDWEAVGDKMLEIYRQYEQKFNGQPRSTKTVSAVR